MTGRTIFCALISMMICATIGYGQTEREVLRDGLTLDGVDGQLVCQDNNSVYFFKPDTDISDDRAVIKAHTAIEILPSAILGKMAAVKNENASAGFRIWGRVTSYKGENYIFVIHFLQTAALDTEKAESASVRLVEDANDTLKLPKEILEKMQSRKIIQPIQLTKGFEMEQDYILVDRTGFIRSDPNGGSVFVFDCLGRNLENISIALMPCYTLQSCESEQQGELEEIRFKISGIVTRYKDGFYLLLQRANRSFSYGNFTR